MQERILHPTQTVYTPRYTLFKNALNLFRSGGTNLEDLDEKHHHTNEEPRGVLSPKRLQQLIQARSEVSPS